MQGKLRKFDFEIVIRFELLDTPGDEITPGSDEIRKYFEHQSIRHGNLQRYAFKPSDGDQPSCYVY
jgi:hypothetical protein